MMAAPRTHRALSPVAGDGLLHPLMLAAIGVLLLNDHVLKALLPGALTGKLSDFAGLLFFPLFLQAVIEVCGTLLGRPTVASKHVLLGATLATATVFSAVKLAPEAAWLFGTLAGHLQWLVGLPPTLLLGDRTGMPGIAHVVLDSTDLIALPVLLVSYRVGVRRAD